MSKRKGATWTDLANTTGGMPALGFRRTVLSLRTADSDGVFAGPSDGSARFEKVSAICNRCLTWTTAGLYACGMEPIDRFAVGFTDQLSKSFDVIYRLADTCPQTCEEGTPFEPVCRTPWTTWVEGAGTLADGVGETCSVAWARRPRDAGADDGGVALTPPPSDNACACHFGGRAARAPTMAATLLASWY